MQVCTQERHSVIVANLSTCPSALAPLPIAPLRPVHAIPLPLLAPFGLFL
jgi:hypothetical protein